MGSQWEGEEKGKPPVGPLPRGEVHEAGLAPKPIIQVSGDLNGLSRPAPAILSGVDLGVNARRIIDGLNSQGLKLRCSPGREQEFERLLRGMSREEVLVHRFYNDPDGSKIMAFIFDSGAALLSRGMMGQSGREVKPGLKADFREDEILGAQEFVFVSKENGRWTDKLHDASDGTSGMVLLKPSAGGVENVFCFNNYDSYYIGGFISALEVATVTDPTGRLGQQLRIGEAIARGLVGYGSGTASVDAQALEADAYSLNHPANKAHVYFNADVWRRIIRGQVLSLKDLDDVRLRVALLQGGLAVPEVFSSNVGLVESILGVKVPWVQDRLREHIEDEGAWSIGQLFDDLAKPKEVLIPAGVGGTFIDRVIVHPEVYAQIEMRIMHEHGGKFTVVGRDWREVVKTPDEYATSDGERIARHLDFSKRLSVM